MERFTKLLVNDTYILLMGDEVYGAIHAEDHLLAAVAADGLLDIGFYGNDSFVLMDGAQTILVDCATLNELDMVSVSAYGGIVNSSEEDGIYYYYENGSISHLPSMLQEKNSYMSLPDKNYADDVLIPDAMIFVF